MLKTFPFLGQFTKKPSPLLGPQRGSQTNQPGVTPALWAHLPTTLPFRERLRLCFSGETLPGRAASSLLRLLGGTVNYLQNGFMGLGVEPHLLLLLLVTLRWCADLEFPGANPALYSGTVRRSLPLLEWTHWPTLNTTPLAYSGAVYNLEFLHLSLVKKFKTRPDPPPGTPTLHHGSTLYHWADEAQLFSFSGPVNPILAIGLCIVKTLKRLGWWERALFCGSFLLTGFVVPALGSIVAEAFTPLLADQQLNESFSLAGGTRDTADPGEYSSGFLESALLGVVPLAQLKRLQQSLMGRLDQTRKAKPSEDRSRILSELELLQQQLLRLERILQLEDREAVVSGLLEYQLIFLNKGVLMLLILLEIELITGRWLLEPLLEPLMEFLQSLEWDEFQWELMLNPEQQQQLQKIRGDRGFFMLKLLKLQQQFQQLQHRKFKQLLEWDEVPREPQLWMAKAQQRRPTGAIRKIVRGLLLASLLQELWSGNGADPGTLRGLAWTFPSGHWALWPLRLVYPITKPRAPGELYGSFLAWVCRGLYGAAYSLLKPYLDPTTGKLKPRVGLKRIFLRSSTHSVSMKVVLNFFGPKWWLRRLVKQLLRSPVEGLARLLGLLGGRLKGYMALRSVFYELIQITRLIKMLKILYWLIFTEQYLVVVSQVGLFWSKYGTTLVYWLESCSWFFLWPWHSPLFWLPLDYYLAFGPWSGLGLGLLFWFCLKRWFRLGLTLDKPPGQWRIARLSGWNSGGGF